MQRTKDDRSLGDLFGDLTRETSFLVRQEIALAKTEITQKGSKIGKDVGFMALGGALAYAGLLAIIAAVIIILANVVPWWFAALLVGVVVTGIGYALIQKGLTAIKTENIAPKRTIQTLKEDAEWAKEQIR